MMADLGTLGGSASSGNAINSLGQVAGSSGLAGNTVVHAFLYIGTPGAADGQMIDLDAWLHATNPTEAAKWTLKNALGLTDTGLVTGYGNYNDGSTNGSRAFLLDASSLVPEPRALSLLTIAGLAALRYRKPL
jgi:probable HAF family extracellular repeat protein